MIRIVASFALLLSLLVSGEAFSVATRTGVQRTVLFSAIPGQPEGDEGDDILSILNRAMACSDSESCSVEEAESLMSQLQVISADGSLSLYPAFNPAEISARLRSKIDKAHAALPLERGFAGVVIFAAACLLIGTTNFGGEEREAFTLQEYWWALRGNYLPTLIMHFIKYGGL